MKKVCVIALLCMIGAVAYAGFADTPNVAGSFDDWASHNPMTDMGGGIWEYTVTGQYPGVLGQFKITQGNWDSSYPGDNSWYYTDASGEVTITFNTNVVSDGWLPQQYRLGLSTDPGSWTIAGSFQDWNTSDPATAMTPMGGGMYSFSQALSAGEYWFKSVLTGSTDTWYSIGEYDRSINTGDLYVKLVSDAVLNVYLDAYAGTIKYEVVPEPITLALLGLGSLIAVHRKK